VCRACGAELAEPGSDPVGPDAVGPDTVRPDRVERDAGRGLWLDDVHDDGLSLAAAQPREEVPRRARRSVATLPRQLRPDEVPCQRCETPNSTTAYFCRRCGITLAQPETPGTRREPDEGVRRPSLWQRLLRRPDSTAPDPARSATKQYRQALRVRHKFIRALAVLAMIGLPVGLVWTHTNPASLFRDRVLDRHKEKPVRIERAELGVGSHVVTYYDANYAIDQGPGNSWATRWPQGLQSSPPCPGRRLTGCDTLVLTVADKRVDAVRVQLAEPKVRKLQFLPRVVHVQFQDGTGQDVPIDQARGEGQIRLSHPVRAASTVRVTVTAADTPQGAVPDAQIGLAAIDTITLLAK
jgi:hypothetical protein